MTYNALHGWITVRWAHQEHKIVEVKINFGVHIWVAKNLLMQTILFPRLHKLFPRLLSDTKQKKPTLVSTKHGSGQKRTHTLFLDSSLDPFYQKMLSPHAEKMKELANKQDKSGSKLKQNNQIMGPKTIEQIQEFVEIGEFTADLYERARNGVE